MHTHYQQSCPLIIRTTNQPLGDPLMFYNNELQLTHTSIIYNLASIHSMGNGNKTIINLELK